MGPMAGERTHAFIAFGWFLRIGGLPSLEAARRSPCESRDLSTKSPVFSKFKRLGGDTLSIGTSFTTLLLKKRKGGYDIEHNESVSRAPVIVVRGPDYCYFDSNDVVTNKNQAEFQLGTLKGLNQAFETSGINWMDD